MLTLLAVTALPSLAQSSLVATLVHDGNISTYYSANALKDAYNAAVDGDIITLSAGTFNATDIAKRITIRGAGCELDKNPTILSGNFEIKDSESSLEQPFTIEGIYSESLKCYKLSNATFLKCKFVTQTTNICANEGDFNNVRILQCHISTFKSSGNNNVVFSNSVVTDYTSTSSSTIEINNCIIYPFNLYSIGGITCTNSYISLRDRADYNADSSNSRFINCIFMTNGTKNLNIPNINCKFYIKGNFDPFENSNYILKAEYASEWLGNDGKEIGIYGGSLPYDPTTTNPQISKFNVSSKTTADGKLSVDIEVKAE